MASAFGNRPVARRRVITSRYQMNAATTCRAEIDSRAANVSRRGSLKGRQRPYSTSMKAQQQGVGGVAKCWAFVQPGSSKYRGSNAHLLAQLDVYHGSWLLLRVWQDETHHTAVQV